MAAPHASRAGPARLIIHCGVQKTGSTSLHHFLGRNRAELEARGLHVLTPLKGTPARVLGRTAAHFSVDPTRENEELLEKAATDLRNSLPAYGTCLVSHENLPGAMIGRAGETRLYPHVTRILDTIDRAMAPLEPEYVFYTRDMAAWKKSVYNQAVKTDSYPRSEAEFLCETENCGSWADLESRLSTHLGAARLAIFRLEDEPDPARPGQQLLHHAGLEGCDLATLSPVSGTRNQSLNAGALEFMRLLNTLDLNRQARTSVARLVTRNQQLFASG